MAAVLRLANLAQTTTVDLLAGTLKLRDRSWSTRTSPPGSLYTADLYAAHPDFQNYPPVVESIELTGAATVANLISAVTGIEALLTQARRWHDHPMNTQSVWLEWNANGENPKRALVYEGSLQILSDHGLNPLLSPAAIRARLWLSRSPFLEPTATSSQVSGGLVIFDHNWTLGTGIVGDEPARIVDLSFTGHNGGGASLSNLWCGIREPFAGTADFQQVWECEDGDLYTNTTGPADATASGGYKCQTTFASAAELRLRWQQSVYHEYQLHSVLNYDHAIGRYLVLARCKVTSGATVGLQLRYGYAGSSSTAIPCEEIYITNTAWMLKPLGVVEIPPLGYRTQLASASYVRDCILQLYAEHVSGTAATDVLDFDCMILVPADHLLTATGANIVYTGGDARALHVYTYEDGGQDAANFVAGRPSTAVEYTLTDFTLPLGKPLIVIAADSGSAHTLTDHIDMAITYAERWLSYRLI